MSDIISNRYKQVVNTIRLAEQNAGRPLNSVRLLAVSKKQSADKIRAVFNAGQQAFGESYLQEALEKQKILAELPIEWHFIGNIQSNKAKLIAQHFNWVQSVDRVSIAQSLNKYRPESLPPLNICIEVNIDQESAKSGVAAQAVITLANAISQLPHLKLRGLMVIPKNETDPEKQMAAFEKVANLQKKLLEAGFLLDTLSMGMSGDLIAAIKSGSTMVRVGTAIFGERDQLPH